MNLKSLISEALLPVASELASILGSTTSAARPLSARNGGRTSVPIH